MFREETLNITNRCEQHFCNNTDTIDIYKLIVECNLALLILFNRRRIGDVQYLKVNDYQTERKSNFVDFQKVPTETEKVKI